MRAPLASPVVERLPALDGVAPADAADAFRDLPGLALLESARRGRAGRWSFLVAEPVAVLDGSTPGDDPFAEARAALVRLDRSLLPPGAPPFAGGLVGHLATTSGGAWSAFRRGRSTTRGCPTCASASTPGRSPGTGATGGRGWPAGRIDGDAVALERALDGVRARAEGALRVPLRGEPAFPRLTFRSEVDRAEWMARVEAVRAAIAAGELYQANLTRRLVAPFDGDPWPVFRRLRAGEPAAFTAYLDLGRAPLGPEPRRGRCRARRRRRGAPRHRLGLARAVPRPRRRRRGPDRPGEGDAPPRAHARRGSRPGGRAARLGEGPRREHDDRRRPAQRPRAGLPAGQRAGAPAVAPGADALGPAPRVDRDGAAGGRPRRLRPPGGHVPRRLDHRGPEDPGDGARSSRSSRSAAVHTAARPSGSTPAARWARRS